MKMPPIYFYIPQDYWPAGELPESADTYWQWQCSMESSYNWSLYNWTLQTYLRLKDDGFPCELVATIPDEGIVVAHRYSLPDELQPGSKLLIVCLQADKGRHTYAQLHVVQNPHDDIFSKSATLWQSYCIPLWTQPGLIPRSSERGDRFENIAYLGRERELAPELKEPSWQEHLEALGLRWHILPNRSDWNDYSTVDAVLAVRSFGRQSSYNWKPPSKLLNAWQAGVPAILGNESAFRNARKSELDYLEVTSVDEAIAALKRLRDDRELRQAMIENGRIRAADTTPASLTARWRNFLTDIVVPAYHHWCMSSDWTRQLFLTRRALDIKTQGMRSQIRRVRGQITSPVKFLISQIKKSI
ncbi:MAG TPA: hypothetical protein DDZ80_18700 [Cyanobacteria bacterium UBA8803]|nr:hypothetical protein [Cyanobacteria bacterium UBA9273]HBL60407.1 hypothetical protein [Cyanobacteria bacterium UBA8803]